MIKPETIKLLSELNNTPYGKALQDFLDEEYMKINDVANCTSWEDTIGRKKALETLERLFSFMAKKQVVASGRTQYS